MRLRFQNITHIAATLCAIVMSLNSCSSSDNKDKTPEPVTQQPAANPITLEISQPVANDASMFRTPKDNQLPTESQLEQGALNSIGTANTAPASTPPAAPSTTITPPKSDEDQLDPGE